MFRKKDTYEEWVLHALVNLDGRANLIEVTKEIWRLYGESIEASGRGFYTWQYDLRWGASSLRKGGYLKQANETRRRGVWELVPDFDMDDYYNDKQILYDASPY